MTRSMTKICLTFSALAVVAAWAGSSQAQTSQVNGGGNNDTLGGVGNVTQAQTSCNSETIKGEYAALANAWNGPHTPPYTTTPPYTPVAALREVLFDGIGNFTSAGYSSTGGTIVPFTLDGTYTVNADCTMTQTSTGAHPTTFFGVITANSNKIYEIRTDANTETIVFERVNE
jgi:hypothetical protein